MPWRHGYTEETEITTILTVESRLARWTSGIAVRTGIAENPYCCGMGWGASKKGQSSKVDGFGEGRNAVTSCHDGPDSSGKVVSMNAGSRIGRVLWKWS